MTPIPTGECADCGYRKRINKDGRIYNHLAQSPAFTDIGRTVCSGSCEAPVDGSIRYGAAADPAPATAADVDYAAGWLDRHLYQLTAAAIVVAAFVAGFAVGAGVAEGWTW